jgi:site-specific DNA-methyltransferase (adenine-specific)
VDEFEYLYFFWKPGATLIDKSRLSPQEWTDWGSRAVWNFPSVRVNDNHEAKFPLELPRRVIRLLTQANDLILDPFIGSGTTALAAIELGRHYIGIELQPQYAEMANAVCEQAKTRFAFLAATSNGNVSSNGHEAASPAQLSLVDMNEL